MLNDFPWFNNCWFICRWKKLFIESFDKFILDPSYYNNVFPTQWKELYILRSNWFSGHCHVQSLRKKNVTPQQTELTKVVCLKISNCGRSLLASVNQASKFVHLWSLIQKRSLHVVSCESVIGCVDFGSECSRNMLAIGLYSNKVRIMLACKEDGRAKCSVSHMMHYWPV